MPVGLERLVTPALLVDEEILAGNIDATAALAASAGVALRPHFKTSKCPQVAVRQRRAGAIGFTCATPAEVRALRGADTGDLLWAHQPVGPAKVDFAVAENLHVTLTVAVDSVEVGEPLAAAADAAGVTIPYLLEIDVGHGRAGVDPDRARDTVRALARYRRLRLRGVFTHEGNVARHADDRAAQRAVGTAAGRTVVSVARELTADGHSCEIVSVGSTPGMDSASFVPGVTETRPGTYVYFDGNQVALGSTTADRCALTVLTRVVSTQRAGTAIVDAGLKALSSDPAILGAGFGLVRRVDGEPLGGVRFGTANEEHGFLTGPGVEALRVGDLLRIVPNHACGAVNMWGQVHVVRGNLAVDSWPVVARHGTPTDQDGIA